MRDYSGVVRLAIYSMGQIDGMDWLNRPNPMFDNKPPLACDPKEVEDFLLDMDFSEGRP